MAQSTDNPASGKAVKRTKRLAQPNRVDEGKMIDKAGRSRATESKGGDYVSVGPSSKRSFASFQVAKFVLREIVENTVTMTVKGVSAPIHSHDLSKHWSPHFTPDEIAELIVPKRTLARRVANQEPLNANEADRAIRVGHVCVEAERVFGNPDKAFRWLRRPNQTLNDQRPIDLLTSHAGVQVVLERLGQIDHGMFV